MKITNDSVVPFDDSLQPDATPSLKATRRLIKVDFSALQMDEEPESDGEEGGGGDDGGGSGPRTHNPWQRTGTASGAAKEADVDRLIGVTHDEYLRYCDSALECRLPPQNACRVTVTTGCCIL